MRRRRQHPPIPSPLLGQRFNPTHASKAAIQVIREIHQANFEVEPQEVDLVIQAAIDQVRSERRDEE